MFFWLAELNHNWVRILVSELTFSERGVCQRSQLYVTYIQMLLKKVNAICCWDFFK